MRLRLATVALLLCSAPGLADASWLRCVAHGTDLHGNFAADTTVVNVGAVPPDRLEKLKQRLRAVVSASTPGANISDIDCVVDEDGVRASGAYARLLNKQSKVLGWDRLEVLTPDLWLADSDYKDGADVQ